MNKAFFTVALQFLIGISTQLTVQLQTDLGASGSEPKIILQNQVLEIKKEITGGGIIDLLTTNTERVDGICSFDKGGEMKTGRAFVFDELALCYATQATAGTDTVGDLEYDVKAPKALQNALVIITQDGREVLRLPFRDLHNVETGMNISDAYSELKSLCHFNDGKKIEIQIKFAEGVSLPTNVKHYVWFRAKGLQTAKKPNA